MPGGSSHRVLLHGLAKKFEALESYLDVLGPGPGTLLDLAVEKLERHLVRRLLSYVEDEHARQHLIENHADRPNIDFMAVACTPAPIRLYLLRRHHQGRALEREGTIATGRFMITTAILTTRILKLPCVAEIRYLNDEQLILQIDSRIVHGLSVGSVRKMHKNIV